LKLGDYEFAACVSFIHRKARSSGAVRMRERRMASHGTGGNSFRVERCA
jgi:hypothetical protein